MIEERINVNSGKKLNIKAIIIGWAVDIGGSFVSSIFIGVVGGFMMALKGVSPEQIAEELSKSADFQNISVFVGFSFTFLGGYIAAFIAKTDELKHALIVGILSLITSLLLSVGTQTTEPVWFLITLFVIPFALLGGYLRKITKKDTKSVPPASP